MCRGEKFSTERPFKLKLRVSAPQFGLQFIGPPESDGTTSLKSPVMIKFLCSNPSFIQV